MHAWKQSFSNSRCRGGWSRRKCDLCAFLPSLLPIESGKVVSSPVHWSVYIWKIQVFLPLPFPHHSTLRREKYGRWQGRHPQANHASLVFFLLRFRNGHIFVYCTIGVYSCCLIQQHLVCILTVLIPVRSLTAMGITGWSAQNHPVPGQVDLDGVRAFCGSATLVNALSGFRVFQKLSKLLSSRHATA